MYWIILLNLIIQKAHKFLEIEESSFVFFVWCIIYYSHHFILISFESFTFSPAVLISRHSSNTIFFGKVGKCRIEVNVNVNSGGAWINHHSIPAALIFMWSVWWWRGGEGSLYSASIVINFTISHTGCQNIRMAKKRLHLAWCSSVFRYFWWIPKQQVNGDNNSCLLQAPFTHTFTHSLTYRLLWRQQWGALQKCTHRHTQQLQTLKIKIKLLTNRRRRNVYLNDGYK